tara:strand:- start:1202 stop:2056 length:855 start_codon:yes stop_codon:yes gene_type:complete
MTRRSRFTRVVGFENNRPHLAGRWRTIWDLNLKGNDISTTGALTENAGSLTTLEGLQYHLFMGTAADQSWTVTADTGIVVDFASSSSAESRLDLKIPHVPRLSDGGFPRLRVSVAFSGLVVSHNADFVGAGIGSYWRKHAASPNPAAWTVYDCINTTPAYQWISRTIKDTLGDGTPTGTESSGSAADPNDANNGVIVIEDAGQGVWISKGDSNTTDIITGSGTTHTYRAQNSTQGYTGYTNSQKAIFWRSNADYDGPYVQLRTKSGNDGSQAITWERIVVEAFL